MKRKIKYQERDVVGVVVPFDVINDNWSEFHLKDGTTIKMRPIVKSIVRLEDEYDQNGDPIYIVQSDPLVMLSNTSEHLRREDARIE